MKTPPSRTFTTILSLALSCAAAAEPVTGRLGAGDDAYGVFAFKIATPRMVDIRMSSEELDSYLHLFAVTPGEGPERFRLVAENDDDNESLNSRLNLQLDTGDYRIVASSLGGEAGPYALTARGYRAGQPKLLVSALGDMARARPAPAGRDAAGLIFGGRPAFAITIPVREAGRLQVDVLALDDWDAILMLEAPNGASLEVNDDMFAVQHSRVIRDVTPGVHTAWITVSNPDIPHSGEFLLNATYRIVHEQADLPLRIHKDDAPELRKLISRDGGEEARWTGREVPRFDLPKIIGEGRLALNDLRGRLVLLDFWEPWCVPCLETMPHLERLHRELGESHKLTVVGIASEGLPSLRREIARLDITYPQLHDPEGDVSEAFEVGAIPRLILIGPDGVALADLSGAHNFDQLREIINEAHEAIND